MHGCFPCISCLSSLKAQAAGGGCYQVRWQPLVKFLASLFRGHGKVCKLCRAHGLLSASQIAGHKPYKVYKPCDDHTQLVLHVLCIVYSGLTSGGTLGAGATICQSELVPSPARC